MRRALGDVLHTSKVDNSLIKGEYIKNISVHLFGGAWKTKYSEEKTLLDSIIGYYRSKKLKVETLISWLVSLPMLRKLQGLNCNAHKDPLIDEDEQKEFEHQWNTEFTEVASDIKTLETLYDGSEEIKTCEELSKQFQTIIKRIQQRLNAYKSVCDTLKSERAYVIFNNKKVKNMRNIKKGKITDYIQICKGSLEFANAFSSSLICSKAKGRFVLTHLPDDEDEVEKILKAAVQWQKDNIKQGSPLGERWAQYLFEFLKGFSY
jgi:hypothetical protein